MKVFLSWSGPISQQIAITLREWIPCVIQSIKPYVSSEDIKKGTRWSIDIAKELQEASFGILCVTKDNISAPWLNFEAGALSKALENAHVVPFLFRLKPSDLQGPLLQFQTTVSGKDEIYKLLETLNTAIDQDDRLSPSQLQKTFEVWWPKLNDDLNNINENKAKEPKEASPTDKEPLILEEILQLTRDQQRLITSINDKISANEDSSSQLKNILSFTSKALNNLDIERQNLADYPIDNPEKHPGKIAAIIERISTINESNIKLLNFVNKSVNQYAIIHGISLNEIQEVESVKPKPLAIPKLNLAALKETANKQ